MSKKMQSIGDFAKEHFPDTKPGKVIVPVSSKPTIVDRIIDKVEQEKVKELTALQDKWSETFNIAKSYNDKIQKLDKDYTSVTPLNKVIVRCFHLLPEEFEVNGQVMYKNMPYIPMPEMTQNGVGIRKTYNSPWLLKNKAVVIALPSSLLGYNLPFSVGDIVQIHQACVLPEKRSIDYDAQLLKGYTIPDYQEFSPPTNPEDKHFGYLLLDIGEILAVIQKANENI